MALSYSKNSIDLLQVCSNNNNTNIEETDEDHNNSDDLNVLCLLYKDGKLGATYYNVQDKIVYIYEEMPDIPPQFLVTSKLLQKINPKLIISFGNVVAPFNQFLIDSISSENNRNSTVTSNSIQTLPPNVCLLRLSHYSYESCKKIVLGIETLWKKIERENDPEVKRNLYLSSLINFDHRFAVQTLAALYKYLEKNWGHFGLENGYLQVMDINRVTMENHVLIDSSSFKALQIFSQRPHEASFKRGSQSSSREGLSLYKLFSSECKSKIGHTCLRNLLLCPINDKVELNKRFDFISFALDSSNYDFIEGIQENIKHLGDVSDINLILVKIENGKATSRNWEVLYKSIYHTICINEICGPHRQNLQIFQDLYDSVSDELITLETSISKALDFTPGQNRRRVAIKFGLDESLDAKMLRQQDILKHVTAAARFVVDDLPDFINECKVSYLPEMGHLVVIKEWEPDCEPDELQHLGFQFMFKLKDTIHYKSPLCVELDKRLGDINAEIIDHENRILRRLSSFTVNYNKEIRKPLKVIALMDCLISMAQVANRSNFVRPNFNSHSVNEINECRHPLLEQTLTQFETNNYYSGGSYAKMKIITGPNGSGKTVFLRQMGLILYMAHIGSFLPVKSANIGLLHSIHCRLQTTEAASVRLSAFMIDVTQASQAIFNATGNSLVILDEFGKGTSDSNGLAILAGVLKKFLSNPQTCPHFLVATHFHKLVNHVPKSQLVQYLKMSHTKEGETLCFLFKMEEGVSDSYAIDVASQYLDKELISRVKYIHECLKNQTSILPMDLTKKVTQPATEVNFPQLDVSDDDNST